jgi:hypothetical protein
MNPVNNFVYYLSADWERRAAHRKLTEDSPLIHQLIHGDTVGTFLAAWYRMGRANKAERDWGLGDWLLRSERSALLDACFLCYLSGVKNQSWSAAIASLVRVRSQSCQPAGGCSAPTKQDPQPPPHLRLQPVRPTETERPGQHPAARKKQRSKPRR